jgi:hypothetical protein
MKSEIPMTPSLPTTAISAEAPSSMTYNNDTIESVGKKTYRNSMPGSYSTSPRRKGTGVR